MVLLPSRPPRLSLGALGGLKLDALSRFSGRQPLLAYAASLMPRRPAPEQQQEFDTLWAQVRAMAEFLQPEWVASLEESMAGRRATRANISGLREARTDLLEMASYLPGEQLRTLDAHLQQRCSTPLDQLQTKRLSRIADLREKGRITTDEQFRLAYGRVEQIWDNPAHAEEFTHLSTLMAAYEGRRSSTRTKE